MTDTAQPSSPVTEATETPAERTGRTPAEAWAAFARYTPRQRLTMVLAVCFMLFLLADGFTASWRVGGAFALLLPLVLIFATRWVNRRFDRWLSGEPAAMPETPKKRSWLRLR